MAAYIGNKRFQLTTALNGLGVPAKWGEITGQISDQADLQQEFQDAKEYTDNKINEVVGSINSVLDAINGEVI